MPAKLDELLRGLASKDWLTVRDSVRAVSAQLADRSSLSATDALEAVRALAPLANHEKWEVRAAVARAAEHFDRETAVAVLTGLAEDENTFVQSAARPLLTRKSRAVQADFLREEEEDLFATWLDRLERQHGPAAREAARKVAIRFTELSVRQIHHELIRALAPADQALENVKLALRHGIDDQATFLSLVADAQGRLDFVKKIIESTGRLVQDVPVTFRRKTVQAAIEDAQRDVEAKWHKISDRPTRVDFDIEPDLWFEVDHQTIEQALANVLENGFESYEAGKSPVLVAVTARLREGNVVVSFTDQGRGMDGPTLRAACRLGSTRKVGGLGFGLALTKRVIESLHGGRLQLTSELGRGTTVTVVLPRHQSSR